jgi:hypothetical protein
MIKRYVTTRQTSYCSLKATTEADKKVLFNAMNNPEFRLSDFINKTLSVKDVFVDVVGCVDKETGEIQPCPRIVLIDEKGSGYACVSLCVYGSIKKIFTVFGVPSTWKTPLKVEVKQLTKGEKKMLTLTVA